MVYQKLVLDFTVINFGKSVKHIDTKWWDTNCNSLDYKSSSLPLCFPGTTRAYFPQFNPHFLFNLIIMDKTILINLILLVYC